MKQKNRIRKLLATLLLLCIAVCAFTACTTRLNGTYVSKEGLLKQTMTFDGDRVSVSAFGIDVEGAYRIEKGEITITYSLLGLSYDWTKSFQRGNGSIIIDGTEFVKEK